MTDTLSDDAARAMASVATEWFKSNRRLLAIVARDPGQRWERERAQSAYATDQVLATMGRVGMKLVSYDGELFSPNLPAEPVNPEDFESEDGLVVIETLEPTVIHDGRVIARGRVVLARGQ